MNIPDSARSIYIEKANEDQIVIQASQPGDCLVLQKHHAGTRQYNELHMFFGSTFMTIVNGPSEQQSTMTWQSAIQHILATFEPVHCCFHTKSGETGVTDGFEVVINKGLLYQAFWNDKQTAFCLKR